MKSIYKIVLTGGPCAGKTTAINTIKAHFSALGFRVLVVSETVTDLICSGISPSDIDNIDFQYIATKTMRFKENMMCVAADALANQNILIVCDRGQMDNAAYMTAFELSSLMKKLDTNIVEMRDMYDAVFYLETSAKHADSLYEANKANNSARTESAERAIAADKAVKNAWVGHPHMRIIPALANFDEKLHILLDEIEHVVGIRGNLEIERKFLIKRPTDEQLAQVEYCHGISITQHYIKKDGDKMRIRKRSENGNAVYFLTKKRTISSAVREEHEIRINAHEYAEYKEYAISSLEKTRYCVIWHSKYFELDLYPFSTDYAILELELLEENAVFELPPFLEVIREVTGEKQYNNSTLAVSHSL